MHFTEQDVYLACLLRHKRALSSRNFKCFEFFCVTPDQLRGVAVDRGHSLAAIRPLPLHRGSVTACHVDCCRKEWRSAGSMPTCGHNYHAQVTAECAVQCRSSHPAHTFTRSHAHTPTRTSPVLRSPSLNLNRLKKQLRSAHACRGHLNAVHHQHEGYRRFSRSRR